MTAGDHSIEPKQNLAVDFAILHNALRHVATVADEVELLHQSGRFHGDIRLDSVPQESLDRPGLSKPADSVTFHQHFDGNDRFPPELIPFVPITLSTSLEESRQLLQERGVAIDPAFIDVYQLGALLCQMLTGRSVESYVSSPRTVSEIPREVRPLIDGAIGVSQQNRFNSAAQLSSAINRVLESLVNVHPDDGSRKKSAPGENQAASREPFKPSPSDSESNDDLPFNRLGHYTILSRIGHGGMGDVYLGYESELDRHVAIKVLPREFAREPDFVRRFRQEAAAAARLTHPNVVQIFFAGKDDGHLFFAMQLVSGDSLAQRLADRSQLTVKETLAIISDVLNGLAAAHQQGLVHRDVKPANVFLESSGRAILGDFGLVKSQAELSGTATGVIMGTVDYISPEQGRGMAVDGRTDLYSTGVMAFQMLSGRMPFEADSPTAMIFQHVYEEPPDLLAIVPHVPSDLRDIVAKLMEKAPDDRYQSSEAVLADIDAFHSGKPLPSGAGERLSEFRQPARGERLGTPPHRTTRVIVAPQWADDRSYDSFDEKPAEQHWWARSFAWLQNRVRRHVPQQLVDRLQNTQQQLDGAINGYQRRCDELRELISEAEQCQREIENQRQEWKSVIDSEEERLAAFAEPAERERILSDSDQAGKELHELDRHASEQSEQLADMRIQCDRNDLRVQQLVHQRDLFAARLQTAQAKAKLVGGTLSRNRQRLPQRTVLLVAGLIFASGLVILYRYFKADSGPSDAALSTERELPVSDYSSDLSLNTEWPIEGNEDSVISLPARIRAMDVAVSRYIDRPAYTMFAVFDDGRIARFYFRDGLDHIGQTSFARIPSKARCVAISPNASYVAFGADDNSIYVYETTSNGARVHQHLSGHVGPVTQLAFSNDESTLLSMGNDRTLRLWEVSSGLEEQRLELGRVPANRFSANATHSRVFVGMPHSVGYSGIWDVLEARRLHAMAPGARNVALSPDSRTALSTGLGHIVSWDATTGAQTGEFGEEVDTVAFALSSRRVLTLGGNGLQLWHAGTGELIHTKSVSVADRGRAQVSLAANGQVGIVSTRDKQLHIVHLPAGPPPEGLVNSLYAPTAIHSIDISADGVWVAGGGDGAISVWNLHRPTSSYRLEVPSRIANVRFSPDGNRVAYGTGDERSKANYVAIRELAGTGMQRLVRRSSDWRRLSGFAGGVISLAWADDGNNLLIGSGDGSLTYWDPRQEKVLASQSQSQPILRVSLIPNSTTAAVTTLSRNLLSWDYLNGAQPVPFLKTSTPCVDHAFSIDGDLIAIACQDGTVEIFNRTSSSPIAELPCELDHATGLCFVPHTRQLVTSHPSGIIKVWRIDQQVPFHEFYDDGTPISAISVTPDARHVIAAVLDGKVNVWKLP